MQSEAISFTTDREQFAPNEDFNDYPFVIKELINSGFVIDYARIADKGLNGEKQTVERGDILPATVRFKKIRLLDNIFLDKILFTNQLKKQIFYDIIKIVLNVLIIFKFTGKVT